MWAIVGRFTWFQGISYRRIVFLENTTGVLRPYKHFTFFLFNHSFDIVGKIGHNILFETVYPGRAFAMVYKFKTDFREK
jgi:hypothetical protein